MRTRPLDPRRLDVEACAKDGRSLEGDTPLSAYARLVDMAHPDQRPSADDAVHWQLAGRQVPQRGGTPQVWLDLRATTRMAMVCQRCLRPVETPVDIDRSIRFVAGEDAAAALDADLEEDVLALSRAFDAQELVEDELLLALPLVPRHEVCPTPLALPAAGADEPAEVASDGAPHPFAALAAWKRPRQDD